MNNFYFYFIVLFLFSCKKEIIPVESVDNPIATHHDLGKKLENPYAIRNIKKALNVLMSTWKQVIQNQDLERSHLYIRFLPKTYEDMLILESDSSLVYESVPFGYENSADLDFYQDPAIPKDQYTWQYAIVEHDYTFPNVQYEILEELYLPTDEEEALEQLAFNMTGNIENQESLQHIMSIDDKEVSAIFSKRYRPSGTLLVQNSFGGAVPLKRAAIQVKTTWWSNVVHTNDDGYYIVDRRYKDIPTVKLWNRNQTNKTTQRWTEHIGFWVSDNLGKGKTFNYTIAHTDGSKRDLWVKATINNAFVIYDDFANKNGIKRPDNVRTWVFSGSDYGGAPLLHNKAFTSYSYFYPAIASKNKENFGSKSAKTGILALSPLMDLITSVTLTHKNLPDIIIGTKGKNTSEIYAMVFHETAHYSHKNQVSNGFWANVQYQAMFDKTKGTYGDGSPIYSSYTGVAEAWSNFIEYQMMYQSFPNTFSLITPLILDSRYNRNMTAYYFSGSTIPSSTGIAADFARWIPSGLLRDLMDNDNNPIQLKCGSDYETTVYSGVDRVSGFTYKQIYDLLTEDVTSIPRLRDKIIRLYPNRNSNKEITELFKLYGY